MGTWKIEIKGTGTHHNKGRKQDAERLAAGLVRDLKSAGHTVREAKFVLTQYCADAAYHLKAEASEAALPSELVQIGAERLVGPDEITIKGTTETILDAEAYLAAKESGDAA